MIWSLIWATIRLIAVYWVARYTCDFSAIQSLFLTTLAALAIEARYFRHSAAKRFQPFSLRIRPNYRDIFTDASFLPSEHDANERDWTLLVKSQAEGDVAWDGVACFVISYNLDSDTHVIAWPESKGYSCRFEFPLSTFDIESLPSAARFPAGCRAGNSRLKVRFGVVPGRHGLNVFMHVDSKWWAAHWTEFTRPELSFDWGEDGHGEAYITVGVVPNAELQCFYNWRPMQAGVSLKMRARAMEALGWRTDRPDGVYSHKYLNFAHAPIDR